MNPPQTILETIVERQPVQTGPICRGLVLEVHDPSAVTVACRGENEREVRCDVLQTSDCQPPRLARGDAVLVWLEAATDLGGVVLGRIGPSYAPESPPQEPPEEVVIEAKQNLTLKCGEGSITMREDGKVLIKGKDLVSRAERTNRVKGGAVAIN